MCRLAYGLIIFSIVFACLSDCVHFEQPSSLFKKQETDAEISCRHDDSNLDVMLWYQQLHNSKSLALIGYSYGKADPVYETEFQNRFKMTREDTTTGALMISNLNLHIKGEGPVLIASIIGTSASFEKGFETGFKVPGKETKKWTLMVDVKEGIDAVYLCAAS
ncbi:hypothetical protein QQF64_034791 [Cirrhinus molitorella]|uniref:Immunoglobulin V-set domain-containing protein n=1 Tax=Cirrhinus molitorella TaxID=172907 RepID=A0ABR3L501_9TELE